ncbi:MFS transporter [Variovorax boronicumulans]|uniref:MFS transporter n=1 Tax=Variovorax boronicumulans TaxID=436515 RepID=UPI001C59E269
MSATGQATATPDRSTGVSTRSPNPWWVVLAAVLGTAVSNGPLLQFSFGVFVKPLSQAFGTDRATVSSAVLIGFLVTGLCTPYAGRLIDRHGVRSVVLPGILLFALSIAALGLSPAAPLPFIALYGIAGIFAAAQSPLPYAKAVAGAFERRRGLALGVSMAGVGIGAALLPHLANMLIAAYGWRVAFVGLGVTVLLCAFPSVYFFLREPVVVTGSTRSTVPGMSAREALRTARFWYLGVVFFAVVMACGGTIAHITAILTDRGVSATLATSAISAAGVSLIIGRLLAGYLLDRFFAPHVALLFILAPLLGVVLLYFPSSALVVLLATVCIGIGLGAEVDLIAFFISRYMGMRAFGEIYGYLFAVFMFGSGLGPFLMGLSFSRTGSYGPAIAAFGAGLVVAAIAMLRMGPYSYPLDGRAAGH